MQKTLEGGFKIGSGQRNENMYFDCLVLIIMVVRKKLVLQKDVFKIM